MTTTATKIYDFVVFGVTGFTGKLAVEYLLEKSYPNLRWAACGRNETKTKNIVQEIVNRVNANKANNKNKDEPIMCSMPPIVTADLVVTTPEQEETLAQIVQQTHIVLTMAGPFEKYGQTLVKLCAKYGVHYADITGETDFVRLNIENHDATARQTKACIVSHCGNDCIPQDLMVYEMFQYAQKQYNSNADSSLALTKVQTFVEFPATATLSGGTTSTAMYQLGKSRGGKKNKTKSPQPSEDGSSNEQVSEEFDPLLRLPDGVKAQSLVTNISPKSNVPESQLLHRTVGPWLMGPVMVNCIRRSNALLQYAPNLQYGDAAVKSGSLQAWMQETMTAAKIAGAIALPSLFSNLVPQPGEGPDRQVMEESYMTLYALGTLQPQDSATSTAAAAAQPSNNQKNNPKYIQGKFHFNKDISYLYTAHLLVEVGMVLLQKHQAGSIVPGVVTPAVAMGHELTERILQTLDATLTIEPLLNENENENENNKEQEK